MESTSRQATAAIKGYMYQFDATILSILNLDESGELIVEGIEDFDVLNADLNEHFQCKYYAASRLTKAELRTAIIPMLKQFMTLDSASRINQCYHLYGYFRDSEVGEKSLTVDELKEILIQHKRSSTTEPRVVDWKIEIGANDEDLGVFAERLKIHICPEYDEHKSEVIESLENAFSVTRLESEEYLYPSALTLVAKLAVQPDISDRRINKGHFVQELRPSRALFNAWALRENGENEFCKRMRRKYFSQRNIDPGHRFFIVETSPDVANVDLIKFLHILRSKWSSHKARRKPIKDRYVPFIYFPSLPDHRVIELKKMLWEQGIVFVDGYPFHGAEFNIEHISSPQTYENKLSLRIICTQSDLNVSLRDLNGFHYIYEFFMNSPISIDSQNSHIIILATSIDMICQII